jgi:uncharacterized protein YgiB involved in biofilm formation
MQGALARVAAMMLAVVTLAAVTLLAASATNAAWCGGSASRDNAIIECGYATAADCAQSVGKSGVCFVDPDVALKSHASKADKQRLGGKG